jgi:hypothetical protein
MKRVISQLIELLQGRSKPKSDAETLRIGFNGTGTSASNLMLAIERANGVFTGIELKYLAKFKVSNWQSIIEEYEELDIKREKSVLIDAVATVAYFNTGDFDTARHLFNQVKFNSDKRKIFSLFLFMSASGNLGEVSYLIGRANSAFNHFRAAALAFNRISYGQAILDFISSTEGREKRKYDARTKTERILSRENDGSLTFEEGQSKRQRQADNTSLNFYLNLRTELAVSPFIIIDSKSLPRSGLHFLKNTLNYVFKERFSFCEWYQEVGCCKRSPCALTGFANIHSADRLYHLRMVKSHDLDLVDPVFNLSKNIQRIILIREPAALLRSWFVLEQMARCRDDLMLNGVDINKIFLLHEAQVIEMAYDIVENKYRPPTQAEVKEWLNDKSKYINGFLEKWLPSSKNTNASYTTVVRYEDVPLYVNELVESFPFSDNAEDIRRRLRKRSAIVTSRFRPTGIAERLKPERIYSVIAENSSHFDYVSDVLLSKWSILHEKKSITRFNER